VGPPPPRPTVGLDAPFPPAPQPYTESGLGSALRIEMFAPATSYERTERFLSAFGFQAIDRADDWEWRNGEEEEDVNLSKGLSETALFQEQAFLLSSREGRTGLAYVADDLEGRIELLRRWKIPFTLYHDRFCTAEVDRDVVDSVLKAVDRRLEERIEYAAERKALIDVRKAELAARRAALSVPEPSEAVLSAPEPVPLPPKRVWEPLLLPSLMGVAFIGPGGLNVTLRRSTLEGTGQLTSPLPGYEVDAFHAKDGKAFDALEAERSAKLQSWRAGAALALASIAPCCVRRSGPLPPPLSMENEEELLTYVGLLVPLGPDTPLDKVVLFWRRLGFSVATSPAASHDFSIVMTDGKVVLSYLPDAPTRAPGFVEPALLYTSTQAPAAIESRLVSAGMAVSAREAKAHAAAEAERKREGEGGEGGNREEGIASRVVRTKSRNGKGTLLRCTAPNGVPVVIASSPPSNFPYAIAIAIAVIGIITLVTLFTTFSTSDAAQRMVRRVAELFLGPTPAALRQPSPMPPFKGGKAPGGGGGGGKSSFEEMLMKAAGPAREALKRMGGGGAPGGGGARRA